MLLSVKNVEIKQYNNLILKHVNLDLKEGEFVYLVGRTGSGKSSLLKTLYAELPIEKGSIDIMGYKLEHIKKSKIPFLRRKLGVIFQDFQLLADRSAYDNLHFVLKATGWKKESEIKDRIKTVLEYVGLESKGYKLPHELSGGEQQRVSIARSLLNTPKLIIADEPTGNLDPEISEEILNLLINISKLGTSILMATHDIQLLKKYPFKTVKCSHGVIQEINQGSKATFKDTIFSLQ